MNDKIALVSHSSSVLCTCLSFVFDSSLLVLPPVCSISNNHVQAMPVVRCSQHGISKKWDLRPETFGKTQHPRPGTHHMGETRDLRPGTLKVRPETRDSSHRWEPGLETRSL